MLVNLVSLENQLSGIELIFVPVHYNTMVNQRLEKNAEMILMLISSRTKIKSISRWA